MSTAHHLLCRTRLLFVAASLAIILSACGYSNPNTRLSDFDLNGDGTISIFLEMWTNQTNLLGLQGHIQQNLNQVLTKSNRFSLSPSKASADYILDGTIFRVEIPGLSYGLFDRAVELRAEVDLGYQLKNANTGKIVLEKGKYTKWENVRVGSDSVQTQANQDLALQSLAYDLAEDIEIQIFYLLTRDNIRDSKDLVPSDDIEELD